MLPHWEWDKLAWQTLPPGGLGINRSPASFLDLNSSWSEWWWCEQGSSNEPAWDCLTNSSRLVDFCSSSNSFYGLNSSTGLSPPCTHCVSTIPLISASLDHPLVHLDHCRPPDSLSLTPFYSPLFIYSAHPFHSLSATHCVLWDRNCSRVKVSFSSGWTGSHQRPGKRTPGWCWASLATYHEYVII